jgi:hypothetical protein
MQRVRDACANIGHIGEDLCSSCVNVSLPRMLLKLVANGLLGHRQVLEVVLTKDVLHCSQ